MIERGDSSRGKWFMAGAVLLPLAVAMVWVNLPASPRRPDDPKELLRRATESANQAAPKPTGKTFEAKGVSSDGAPVQTKLTEVREKGGRAGYLITPREPLQEGETRSVKMPGGGQVFIGRLREGETPTFPSAVKNPPRSSK